MELRGNVSEDHKLLTDREIQVLTQMLNGAGYKDISKTMFRSAETVRQTAYNLFRKFGVGSRVSLTEKAIKQGLFFQDKIGVKRGIKLCFKEKTFFIPAQAISSNNR
jgi:DNA-binding CsgD family transcriptional regulator